MKKVLFKILLIVLILEMFIFNFNSFRVLSNKNKQVFSNKDIIYLETEDNDITIIQLDNIKCNIKTLHIELSGVKEAEYRFLYTDETTKDFMGTPSKMYIDNLTNSKYISTYLSGNSESIKLEIYRSDIEVKSISINEKIPFNFNFARVMIVYLILLTIYLVKNNENFKIPYSNKNFIQELILILVVVCFIFITCYINDFSKTVNEYDFYNYNFINSLKEGKVHLKKEVSERFLELENPYDVSQRNLEGLIRGEDYIWDAAYYNGKYYVYFGILPALILMLPYHFITNNYMLCSTAVLIFSILTIIALKKLVKNLFNRYFKNIPFKFMFFSLIILLFGSQILILNGIPRFYELPIISGMFFVIAGMNFMFSAIEKDEINYLQVFLSCLFFSLAVACRPTQLFVSLIILPLLIKILINNIKQKKNIFKLFCAVGIPYISIGILLMIYNYIRFENVFEFGTSYQITINDMLHLDNRFSTIIMGIVCNLFSIPNFIPNFPFIYNHNNLMTFYGYYYIENMVGGLFIFVPICFSIFGIYTIFKESKNKEICKMIMLFTAVGLIILSISAIMAGSMQRYMVDYAWILIVAGITSLIEIYNIYKTDEAKRIIKKIFGLLTIYIVVINFCAGIVSEKSFMKNNSPEEYYKLKYSINFWE